LFRGIVRTIHFVGIGGIGMSGIAEVLLTLGFRVTGSDLREGAALARLRGLGAVVHVGHDAANLGEADVVVRSTAVGAENPEIRAALDRAIPVIPRAEMLAELMRLRHGIAVGGSHGKTTTTSMVAACLSSGGLDPTIVIGGRLDSLGGTNARLGRGEWLVAEADESDGSFSLLSPTVSLVTNVDPEHLDHHGSFEALVAAFEQFASKVPFYGFSVLCVDHPVVAAMVPKVARRVVTYGQSRPADVRAQLVAAEGLRTTFRAFRHGEELGTVTLGMPGAHNVTNAVGAIAVATELGVPWDAIRSALDGFGGVQRRFTVVGEAGGVMVVDDYGHHPVEIEATLSAAARGFPERRIVAVFQPHRYSRLQSLWDGFCGAFGEADHVVVCPVYRAGEAPIPGIDHETIARALRERGHRGTEAVADLAAAEARVAALARPGDVVLLLGAGDVNKLAAPILAALGARP
jgi:UDP-N-acetylmuramate--alanine ligase